MATATPRSARKAPRTPGVGASESHSEDVSTPRAELTPSKRQTRGGKAATPTTSSSSSTSSAASSVVPTAVASDGGDPSPTTPAASRRSSKSPKASAEASSASEPSVPSDTSSPHPLPFSPTPRKAKNTPSRKAAEQQHQQPPQNLSFADETPSSLSPALFVADLSSPQPSTPLDKRSSRKSLGGGAARPPPNTPQTRSKSRRSIGAGFLSDAPPSFDSSSAPSPSFPLLDSQSLQSADDEPLPPLGAKPPGEAGEQERAEQLPDGASEARIEPDEEQQHDQQQEQKLATGGGDKEGSQQLPKRCPYFLKRGGCRKGNKCRLLHELSPSPSSHLVSSHFASSSFAPRGELAATPAVASSSAAAAADAIAEEDPPKQQQETKQCPYNGRPGGCRRGDSCKLAHDAPPPPRFQQQQQQQQQRCIYFSRKGGCRNGYACPLLHELPASQQRRSEQQQQRSAKGYGGREGAAPICAAKEEEAKPPSYYYRLGSWSAEGQRGNDGKRQLVEQLATAGGSVVMEEVLGCESVSFVVRKDGFESEFVFNDVREEAEVLTGLRSKPARPPGPPPPRSEATPPPPPPKPTPVFAAPPPPTTSDVPDDNVDEFLEAKSDISSSSDVAAAEGGEFPDGVDDESSAAQQQQQQQQSRSKNALKKLKKKQAKKLREKMGGSSEHQAGADRGQADTSDEEHAAVYGEGAVNDGGEHVLDMGHLNLNDVDGGEGVAPAPDDVGFDSAAATTSTTTGTDAPGGAVLAKKKRIRVKKKSVDGVGVNEDDDANGLLEGGHQPRRGSDDKHLDISFDPKRAKASFFSPQVRPDTLKRKVSFTIVTVAEFKRSVGGGTVPVDGTWPLALGDAVDAVGGVKYVDVEEEERLAKVARENSEREREKESKKSGGKKKKGPKGSGSDGVSKGENPQQSQRSWRPPNVIFLCGDVDTFELRRQHDLTERARRLGLTSSLTTTKSSSAAKSRHEDTPVRSSSFSDPPLPPPLSLDSSPPARLTPPGPGSETEQRASSAAAVVETRQWDYRRGHNPLFRRLTERERKQLILDIIDPNWSRYKLFNSGAGGGGANSPSRREHRQSLGGFGDLNKNGPNDFDVDPSLMETLNEAVSISNSLRGELENMRETRIFEVGCQCRRMNVQKIGKMKDPKLKEELVKRKVDVAGMGREEMIAVLKDIGGREKICSIECSCALEGIECHWEVCGCHERIEKVLSNAVNAQSVKGPTTLLGAGEAQSGFDGEDHGEAGEEGGGTAAAASEGGGGLGGGGGGGGVDTRCGNEFGVYKVDSKTIDSFRDAILSGLCGPAL